MNKNIGIVLLLAVIVIAGILSFLHPAGGQGSSPIAKVSSAEKQGLTSVKVDIGGEKLSLMQSQMMVDYLARNGLVVEPRKIGSIEMVTEPIGSKDALWPASDLGPELFKASGRQALSINGVFNSPIVIYSWNTVTDALVKQKIVERVQNTYYVIDLPKLLKLLKSHTKWTDIGQPDLYGSVKVFSTDPTKSNSGLMFSGLIANVLSGQDVADESTIDRVLPEVSSNFSQLGMMEGSSGTLFEKFVEQGQGAYPLMIGYENQLREYGVAHPNDLSALMSQVRILYPRPTVWSNHPMIALTPNGKRLLDALRAEEAQRIAWEVGGFRTGLSGSSANDMSLVKGFGIPAQISSVVSMPNAAAMRKLIAALKPAK